MKRCGGFLPVRPAARGPRRNRGNRAGFRAPGNAGALARTFLSDGVLEVFASPDAGVPVMKILVATDGSRHAREALRLLSRLRLPPASLVEFVAVLPPVEDGPGAAAPATGRYEDRVPRARAERWLDEARRALAEDTPGTPAPGDLPRPRVQTTLLVGEPESALVAHAETGGHDLILAGVKGRGAGPFFELGRVALHLIRHAPVSVLLVRRPRKENDRLRILLPTDGDATCLEAAWTMVEQLTPAEAGVEVVSVAEPALARIPTPAGEPGWSAARGEPATTPAEPSEPLEPARRWLSQAVLGLSDRGIRSPGTLLHGRPASAISRWAASSGSDLVVLGSRRADGTETGHLGRTGRELAWSSPCSVLMVRA